MTWCVQLEVLVVGNLRRVAAIAVGKGKVRSDEFPVELQHIQREIPEMRRLLCDLIVESPGPVIQSAAADSTFPAAGFKPVKPVERVSVGGLHAIELQVAFFGKSPPRLPKLAPQLGVWRHLRQN